MPAIICISALTLLARLSKRRLGLVNVADGAIAADLSWEKRAFIDDWSAGPTDRRNSGAVDLPVKCRRFLSASFAKASIALGLHSAS